MAYQDNCVQISGGAVSRRTLVAGIAAGAGAWRSGSRNAVAAESWTSCAAEHHNQPAARFRSERTAQRLFHRPRCPHR